MTTFNGWPRIHYPSPVYFTAPNGKRVYVANKDVATVFEYVARQWHERIERLPAAANNAYPDERRGYIVIHAQRPRTTTVGTGSRSNHVSGTAMDILGERHPYEATNPPHLRGAGYRDGFSNAQRAELRKIQREIGVVNGVRILRLGIDFAVGKRDGMHVEIAPGVTKSMVATAAARLRRAAPKPKPITYPVALSHLGYARNASGTRAYQKYRGLTEDGIPGPITLAALEADMSTVLERLNELSTKLDHLPGNVWGRLLDAPGSDAGQKRADTFLRYVATRPDLARVEAALAEVNGHEVDVKALAALLTDEIAESVADAIAQIDVPGADPKAIAKATTDLLAARLAPSKG